MKLSEVLSPEQNPNWLFHSTTIKNAASIITSGVFKLKKIPRSKPPQFVLSTTPSMKSAFIDLMHGAGQTILVLNKRILQKQCAIRPYVCPDARAELGDDFDEMEEQLVCATPVMQIPKPLNRSIIKVIFYTGETEKGTGYHYTKDILLQFQQLCQSHKIPLDIKQYTLP